MTSAAPSDRLLIVPAWNEQDALPQVLPAAAEFLPEFDIVVINDGSTDATGDVARGLGFETVELPINLGVGGAMRAGYLYALRHGYSITVQFDADGQHEPADVRRLVETLLAEQADIVIGARFAGEGDYRARGPRRWAMWVLAKGVSRVAQSKLTDVTSGLKACGPRAVRLFANHYPAEYLGDTVEALVIAARAGLRIMQRPASMNTRVGGTPSHSPFKAALFLARAVLALAIALVSARVDVPDGTVTPLRHPADEATA